MPFFKKLRNLVRSRRLGEEIDEEMAFHLELREQQNRRAGLSPEEAREAARRRFGNETLLRERTRDVDIVQWLDSVLGDLRYCARTFARTPVVTGAIVLSLALGIGANTAIFSLTHALLLKTLPVREPERLRAITLGRNDSLTNPIWEQLRDSTTEFESAFAWGNTTFDGAPAGERQPLGGAYASGAVFRTLGLEPAAGRFFSEAEDSPSAGGSAAVAVLEYDFWQSAYAGDPGALGRSIRLDGRIFTIIGVAPPRFHGVVVGQRARVIVPLAAEAYVRGENSSLKEPFFWWLNLFARLKPGVTDEQARAQLHAISPGILERTRPPEMRKRAAGTDARNRLELADASRGESGLSGQLRIPMLILNVVVAIVLLIACSNVANLLLARAASRDREISVRIAIGASRGRVARQIFTESLLLSLSGGALGLLLAPRAADLLTQLSMRGNEQLFLDVSLDFRLLAFTAGVAVLCGLLFGLAPAWRAGHACPQPGLRESQGAVSDRRGRLRQFLVAGQIALCVLLLIASGLFLSTLRNLMTQETGYGHHDVLIVQAEAERTELLPDARGALYQDILGRLRGLPGVRSAASLNVTPISGSSWQMPVTVPQDGEPRQLHTWFNRVSEDFFATFGTPLLGGRTFKPTDTRSAPPVAVVNETFAREAFGGGNPLGRIVTTGGFRPGERSITYQIVGIVRDAKYRSLRDPAPPTLFLADSQDLKPGLRLGFAIRPTDSLERIAPSVRRALADANPALNFTLRTFSSYVTTALAAERAVGFLCTAFGVLALLLAAIGLYGVISYSIAQRRGEIGLRVALGASPGSIRAFVLNHSVRTILAGLTAGFVLAGWSLRYARTVLYGVTPGEAWIYASAGLVLLFIAALASWMPARRAMRIDPVAALRHE